jgi:hypothetical protein
MKHSPHYIATIAKLMPILHAHAPLRGMGFDQLCDYLAYFWNHGTMSYVMNADDSPAGVCLIKLFCELESFLDEFIHEPDGEFCMVILLAADTPNTIAQLFYPLVDRWGEGRVMLWDRGERTENGAPKMYTWENYLKLTRRLTYGLVENARNL